MTWRVKDYADGWWYFDSLMEAIEAADNGNLIQFYSTTGQWINYDRSQ